MGAFVCEILYGVKLVQGVYLNREVEMATSLQAHFPSTLASKKHSCVMIIVLHSCWNKLHLEMALLLNLQIITWILVGNLLITSTYFTLSFSSCSNKHLGNDWAMG
jgi:hypothetical protein